MRIAVVGSRTFRDLASVSYCVALLPHGTEVITGGARGVDQVAEAAALGKGLRIERICPDYAKHGHKIAPLVRNRQIVETCDRVIAFWKPPSGGTANAIAWAMALGKPVEVRLDRGVE